MCPPANKPSNRVYTASIIRNNRSKRRDSQQATHSRDAATAPFLIHTAIAQIYISSILNPAAQMAWTRQHLQNRHAAKSRPSPQQTASPAKVSYASQQRAKITYSDDAFASCTTRPSSTPESTVASQRQQHACTQEQDVSPGGGGRHASGCARHGHRRRRSAGNSRNSQGAREHAGPQAGQRGAASAALQGSAQGRHACMQGSMCPVIRVHRRRFSSATLVTCRQPTHSEASQTATHMHSHSTASACMGGAYAVRPRTPSLAPSAPRRICR